MSLKKLIVNYSSYNEWANKEFVGWVATLEEAQIKQKTPSSFESIGRTLKHMTMAQQFWLQFIREGNPTDFDWSFKDKSISVLLSRLSESSEKLRKECTNYQEADLLEQLTLNQPWLKNTLCRYEYIMHVINHGTYHRGQIVTIARHIGVTEHIPNTDYNVFNSPG
jgi:uncharacterized damage-inducible protein DinB